MKTIGRETEKGSGLCEENEVGRDERSGMSNIGREERDGQWRVERVNHGETIQAASCKR
jgi:hypothetical protein